MNRTEAHGKLVAVGISQISVIAKSVIERNVLKFQADTGPHTGPFRIRTRIAGAQRNVRNDPVFSAGIGGAGAVPLLAGIQPNIKPLVPHVDRGHANSPLSWKRVGAMHNIYPFNKLW